MQLVAILIILVVACQHVIGAETVIGTNIRLVEVETDLIDFVLTTFVAADADRAGLHDLLVDRMGTTLSVRGETLGAPAYWFTAVTGDHFTPAAIAGGTFTSFRHLHFESGEHYFGVTNLNESNPSFYGWAKLRIDANGVELLDNVVIYDNHAGIVIGTTMIAPEPSGFAVCLCAFLAIGNSILRIRHQAVS